MGARFLSCDWGTSSFRLRLVEQAPKSPLHVIAETTSDEGVDRVRKRIPSAGAERERTFASMLELACSRLGAPPSVPALVSGMASSSIGWKEVPYTAVPFPLDGSAVGMAELAGLDGRRVALISGIRTDSDVLRGEETQLLGLYAVAPAGHRMDSIAVLPGTHSKHVRIQKGSVTGFTTYMTGELYSVLAEASVLRHSVDVKAPWNETAFREGVLASRERGLAASLFSVRARQLLRGLPMAENASYLSGLVVGAEVADLIERAPADVPFLLCASGALASPYAAAFGAMGLADRTLALPAELVEIASVFGHGIVFLSHLGGDVS